MANNLPYQNGALTATAVLAVSLPLNGYAVLNTIIFGNESNSVGSFLQFFDAASVAAVTLGTTAPLFVVDAPAFLGNVVNLPTPYKFVKGVVIAATTTQTGNTAPGSNCSCSLMFN